MRCATHLRSACNVEIDGRLRNDARREVRRRDTNHAFSNVGSQHDGKFGICAEDASRTTAASLDRVAFDDEAGVKKIMQSLNDGDAREPGHPLKPGP